ncbi:MULTISPECIES: hypothetical protein, partial [unclassified Neisseria]|uniref:hypothetical protein n=1 Tax=unclassified Neisseria TaxID=2623750 RepID=UPI001ADDC511
MESAGRGASLWGYPFISDHDMAFSLRFKGLQSKGQSEMPGFFNGFRLFELFYRFSVLHILASLVSPQAARLSGWDSNRQG